MENLKEYFADKLKVKIFGSGQELGKAAANEEANQLADSITFYS